MTGKTTDLVLARREEDLGDAAGHEASRALVQQLVNVARRGRPVVVCVLDD
jgi:hypothetical protein